MRITDLLDKRSINPVSYTHLDVYKRQNHMNHVSTQLPYVIVVAVISCVTYVIAGFVQNPVVPLIIGLVILIGAFTGTKYINKGKSNE